MSVIADVPFSAAGAIAEDDRDGYAPADAPPALPLSLSRHLPLVEDALRWALPPSSSPLGKMCAYHLGWASPEGEPTAGGGGKLFRAGLAIWAIGHFIAVWAAKRDAQFVDVARRHLRYPSWMRV